MAEAVLEQAPGQLSEGQLENHSTRLIANFHSTFLSLPQSKEKYEQFELDKKPFIFEKDGFSYEVSGDMLAKDPELDIQKTHSDKPQDSITQIHIGYVSNSDRYGLSYNKSKINADNQLEIEEGSDIYDDEQTVSKIEDFLKELKEGSPLTSS